tara:strand:+ start:334 stop:504 length:171 start_codon:yes stop_codon:yes gene_type:complete
MDLNPVAFAPSARTPHIPNTDLSDTLKIYGDAEVTVSDESDNVAPVADGFETEGAF